MITIALAALAAATTGPVTIRPQAEGQVPATAAKPSAKQTRYCVQSTNTGTRIPVRECRTRAEWLDLGFDPLAKD
jgi:hypothetical protein